MEINLNGNIGARPATAGQMPLQSEIQAVEKSDSRASELPNIQTSELPSFSDPVQSAEPTADVPESELRRDDALGKLVDTAFNLQAPPLPKFD